LSRGFSTHGRGARRSLPHRFARWLSKLLVAASFGALIVAAQPARLVVAAETDFYVSLRYEIDGAVRRCWDEAEFRRSVAHRVGYDPFRENTPVNVSIRVGGSTRAVDGQVEWQTTNGKRMGERRFIAKDGNCTRLLAEMSFAVALQIELLTPKTSAGTSAVPSAEDSAVSSTSLPIPTTGALPSARPPPSPPPATPRPAEPEPDVAASATGRRSSEAAAPTVEPESSAPSSWPMWFGIGPSLALGIAPTITGDARLFFGVRRNELSVEVGVEASYPSTERQWDGTGFRQYLIGASAAFCGHRQALSACVLGKASQVRVSGLGVDNPRSPTGFVAQAGLRIARALQLGGPWSATAHLDALGLLTPYTVELSQADVWDMPRLGALAGIDVSARFR
jgi:hypothetical protein